MGFMEAVQTCFSKYATFEGRARRSEYWYFCLFNSLMGIVLFLLGMAIKFPLLSSIYSLAAFLPGLAVIVRRLHDIGKSGWWYFIICVPIVGWILLLVWFCTDSQQGDNQYGPNPKAVVE